MVSKMFVITMEEQEVYRTLEVANVPILTLRGGGEEVVGGVVETAAAAAAVVGVAADVDAGPPVICTISRLHCVK